MSLMYLIDSVFFRNCVFYAFAMPCFLGRARHSTVI